MAASLRPARSDCPHCLISMTPKSLRGNQSNLLISYVKPFKEVTVSRGTLTRCMGMTSYGIGRLSCF